MTVTMICVKRVGNSILEDLRNAGFKQVNVISFCMGDKMLVIQNNFGITETADLLVSDDDDATDLIEIFKKNGMYVFHEPCTNPACDDLIAVERIKCKMLKR